MKNIGIIKSIRCIVKITVLTAVVGWLLFFVLPWGCTSQKSTVRTLEAAGYKNVEITGWRPFMRSDNEWFSTGFRATGSNGAKARWSKKRPPGPSNAASETRPRE